MPFLDHFDLTVYPFGLTPNPHIFYPQEQAQAILTALEFALQRGDGLLKVVGEVGTGKTLLCRMLLERLDVLGVNTAYLNAPLGVSMENLPRIIAQEFGIDESDNLRDYLLREHAEGRRNVLIIDEAQALGVHGLEAVRLLSNLETDTDKLLQIVLFGQTELDILLQRHELRQCVQRISFSFTTEKFHKITTADYVRFRLECCAKQGIRRVLFHPEALQKLAKSSGGVPRLIHTLADKAMLAAYADNVTQVQTKHIRVALRETPKMRFWFFLWLRRCLAV